MIRTFNTHSIRKQRELTGRYWNFTPCQGDYAGESFKVATPSCFESYPKFANYRGQGEYSTTFEAQGNIRLEFKGVSHTAEVFLDGRKIAEHYNAYTIFDAVCTDLKPGVHTLMVRADNRFSEKSALHIPNDYMTYGGIIRPIVLEEVRAAYIQYVHVTPYRANGKWNARVTVKLKNVFSKDSVSKEEKRFDLALELAGLNVMLSDIDITTQQEITTECVFENVEAWTPEHPQLYEVQVRLLQKGMVYDDLIDRFGFREIHVSGKEIYLNDKKIRIKGLCRHEDHPQFGCALPFAAMAADLELIKDLGANSIRMSHYPNDEIFLDMCDENGIFVWEENHARGLSEEAMRNSNFEWQAEQVITEMIPAHYNHPSIYIWGILNECASETEYGRECYRRQFDLIRSLDTSRPCSFASCKIKTDICLDLPDVVSYNIYPLWYHDTPVEEYLDDLYQWIQRDTKGSGKPFLVTEIGAGGLYGYRNAYHSKWTEEYQAQALEKQLTAVLSYKDCMGVYIWQFCDIRISDECFAGRPRTMNNKGIVDEYRRAKLAYDVVKRIYHEIN